MRECWVMGACVKARRWGLQPVARGVAVSSINTCIRVPILHSATRCLPARREYYPNLHMKTKAEKKACEKSQFAE